MNQEETTRQETSEIKGAEKKIRRIPLHQILKDDREIEVVHEDAIYRLRITAAGKLLLTK